MNSYDTPLKLKTVEKGLKPKTEGILKHIKKDRQLLILFLPCLVFYIVFRYGPMYGIIIAFKDYGVFTGIAKSTWVGFKYFIQFFTGNDFWLLTRNTFLLGFYSLVWTFPFPIAFAILLNEIRGNKIKKAIQSVSCLPTFLSVVVVCSMVIDLLSPSHGLINSIISTFGFEKQYFMIKPQWFRTVYIVSDIWKNMGYSSIIILAALCGIDNTLYEAGTVDGCGRFKSIWFITLPGILPTIATMFIISSGNMIRVGFEKIILLYNPTTYEVADVFATYVYRKGILETNYSYATAVGLFESLVSLALLLITNYASKKMSEQSLW